jgi:hypothetical protein
MKDKTTLDSLNDLVIHLQVIELMLIALQIFKFVKKLKIKEYIHKDYGLNYYKKGEIYEKIC